MHANLDALLTAIHVLTDDFLQPRRGRGRPPLITDAELITLAIAQAFIGLPNDRQFSAPGSGCGYSLSLPGFGTTPRSAGRDGASPPTGIDLESII